MPAPTIVAAGLICLDVIGIESHELPVLAAGGFPNMLILLHTRGWQAIPTGEVGEDRAADYALNEIAQWGVDTRFVARRADILTPVYVLYHQENGHYFGKECPYCRTAFPRYVPPKEETGSEFLRERPSSVEIFYFDKVTRTALGMARALKDRGTLVMFEPNRIDDPDLFRECAAVADILKYSRERRAGIEELLNGLPVPLELETAGCEGLQYRIMPKGKTGSWRSMPAPPVLNFRDAAGAGDWLTASILQDLERRDRFFQVLENPIRLEEILMEGQQASAYNCRFPGARGGLYAEMFMPRGDDFCPYCGGNPRLEKFGN